MLLYDSRLLWNVFINIFFCSETLTSNISVVCSVQRQHFILATGLANHITTVDTHNLLYNLSIEVHSWPWKVLVCQNNPKLRSTYQLSWEPTTTSQSLLQLLAYSKCETLVMWWQVVYPLMNIICCIWQFWFCVKPFSDYPPARQQHQLFEKKKAKNNVVLRLT